ncbi:hypothetical protein SAMD00079811_17160 [Scytonema sp. HK-05]|nr:hypothetical protein SAMD00079811_17160 [Scytonema sp. HK-05]
MINFEPFDHNSPCMESQDWGLTAREEFSQSLIPSIATPTGLGQISKNLGNRMRKRTISVSTMMKLGALLQIYSKKATAQSAEIATVAQIFTGLMKGLLRVFDSNRWLFPISMDVPPTGKSGTTCCESSVLNYWYLPGF